MCPPLLEFLQSPTPIPPNPPCTSRRPKQRDWEKPESLGQASRGGVYMRPTVVSHHLGEMECLPQSLWGLQTEKKPLSPLSLRAPVPHPASQHDLWWVPWPLVSLQVGTVGLFLHRWVQCQCQAPSSEKRCQSLLGHTSASELRGSALNPNSCIFSFSFFILLNIAQQAVAIVWQVRGLPCMWLTQIWSLAPHRIPQGHLE